MEDGFAAMQDLNLQIIDPNDPRWLYFVQQHADANIFHHAAWLNLLKECYGYRPFVLALCDADGLLQASLPFMEVNSPLRGCRWISIPFSDYCVPLASNTKDIVRLTNSLRLLASKPKSPSIEVRWNIPGLISGQNPIGFVLHTLSMETDLEKVNSRIHHSHRRNVRTAQEQGIQIRHGRDIADLEIYYGLHLETRRRQGIPIQPVKYFRLLDEILLKKGLGFISLAYRGSQCLAGAIFLHWNRTLTYKYGASTESGLSFRPNHLIFWDAIKWGCEHGYSLLDFGRSDCNNDGLRLFKSRWGAEEVPLSYSYFPSETRSPIQEHFLMSAIQTIIRKTPSYVCKLGGEIYYRIAA